MAATGALATAARRAVTIPLFLTLALLSVLLAPVWIPALWLVDLGRSGTKGATRFSYRDWVENTPAVVHSQTYSVYPDSIKNTVHYFLDDCILKDRPPLSSLEDAITCQRIIEGCEQAVAERRAVDLH